MTKTLSKGNMFQTQQCSAVQCGGTICSGTFNDMVSYGLPTNEAISILLALQTWKPLRYESEFAKGSKYVLMPLSHAFIPFTAAVKHFQVPQHLMSSQNHFQKDISGITILMGP